MSLCRRCSREFTPVSGFEMSLDSRASHCEPCRLSLESSFLATLRNADEYGFGTFPAH
jgi:hypothetical protein